MEIIGYIAAVFIGVSLGLIGGGGSILTVPVLVYLFGINPILSTSYSLFIVGSTSLIGAYNNYRKQLVSIKTALLFGLSSITTVFITRKWLMPLVPDHLFSMGGFIVTKSLLTLILFALLMILAAVAMIKNGAASKDNARHYTHSVNVSKLLLYGVLIGLATGNKK